RRDERGLERVVTGRLRASTCNGGGTARLAQRACRNHGDCRQYLAASALDGRAVQSSCIAVSLYRCMSLTTQPTKTKEGFAMNQTIRMSLLGCALAGSLGAATAIAQERFVTIGT